MLHAVRAEHTTVIIQKFLDDLNHADDVPAEPLVRNVLEHSITRLHWLCELMLQRHYPRLMHGPLNLTADELLGGVVERLLKAMQKVRPQTVPQFFALANRHMRWELNEFVRRLDIEGNASEFHDSRHPAPHSLTTIPASANASRILDALERLSEEEREVFTLVRIQGITQVEAAEILGISDKTVQRRLKRSLIFLHQVLHDIHPAPDPAHPRDAP